MKNMLSNFARVKVLAVVLGVAFALTAAHAETKGKFTLTSETHWGEAVLAPGAYEFTLDSASVPSRVLVRASNDKVIAILVPMCSSTTSSASDRLELETHDGATYVSAMYLSAADAELHFTIPKIKEGAVARVTAPASTMTASVQ